MGVTNTNHVSKSWEPILQVSNEKEPGYLLYIWDDILHNYIGIKISHEIRIPSLINQYFMECKAGAVFIFFVAQFGQFGVGVIRHGTQEHHQSLHQFRRQQAALSGHGVW